MPEDILASALSENFIKKLISFASQEIDLVWGVKGELTKLHQTLINIQAVLTDAEKKQLRRRGCKYLVKKSKRHSL